MFPEDEWYIYIYNWCGDQLGLESWLRYPQVIPVHFGAPYAPFSKPQGSPFKRVNFFQRFTKFWVILTQDPAKISPPKVAPIAIVSSCHSQRSCCKSSNLELPRDHTGDALAGFRCCCFLPRNPDAIHWHVKQKISWIYTVQRVLSTWPRWNSHQAGQGACTNYSLKRTKERGLRCTGSHSHGQEHGHIGWQAMWFPWFSMVHKLWKLCSKYGKPHDPKQTPYVYGAFSSPPSPTLWLWVPIYSVFLRFLLPIPTACTVAPTNFDGPKPDTWTACQKKSRLFSRFGALLSQHVGVYIYI